MDANIIDELFNRINILEQENNELKKRIQEKEEENKNKLINKFIEEDVDENYDVEMEIEEFNTNAQESNIVEETITFTPFDNADNVKISADFTNWEPVDMVKSENVFSYTVELLKGFKYFYRFHLFNDIQIDFNGNYEENPANNQTNNFIEVYDNLGNIKSFDCSKDIVLLKNAKLDALKSLLDNIDEKSILEKIVNFSLKLRNKQLALNQKRDIKLNIAREFYDTKISNLQNKLANPKYRNISNLFKGRIFQKQNIYYYIVSIDITEANIRCIRLYDRNHIKINIQSHLNSNNLEDFPLNNIFQDCVLYNMEDSQSIYEDFNLDNENILKIYYELVSVFGNGEGSNEKEILPYKIIPDHIDFNSYNLAITENHINEVRTKENNLLIHFEAQLIKEVNDNKFSGLVSTSSVKIYTTLYNKDIVNILHMHLNDTSEEIAIDSIVLEKGDIPENHKNFFFDALGKKLNYKLIFRDYKLIKVYYNLSEEFIDEPSFEEVRINPNKYVKIINHEIYSNCFAKIANIPIGMLSRKDKDSTEIERMKSMGLMKEGYCAERHLEELPGFIYLQVLFTPDNQMISDPITISIPVCKVIPLTAKEELAFEKALIKTQMIKQSKEKEELESIHKEFIEFERLINFESNSLTTEICKNILNRIENEFNGEKFQNLILESEENSKTFNDIISIKERIHPKFHQQLRILMFSNK